MDPKISTRVKEGWKPKGAEAEDATAAPVETAPAARRAKTPDVDDEPTRRMTFVISTDLDFKLSVYARKVGKCRSAIIEECLRDKLRGVVISFRGKSSEETTAA